MGLKKKGFFVCFGRERKKERKKKQDLEANHIYSTCPQKAEIKLTDESYK